MKKIKFILNLILITILSISSFADDFSKDYFIKESVFNIITNLHIKEKDVITKEKIIVLVANLLNEDDVAKNFKVNFNFEDVPKDSYYAPYIAWSKEHKIILGKSDEIFGFNDKINSKELSTIFLRILGYEDNANWEYTNPLENANKMGFFNGVNLKNIDLKNLNIFLENVFKAKLKDRDIILYDMFQKNLNIKDKFQNIQDLQNLNETQKFFNSFEDINLTNRNEIWYSKGPNDEDFKVLPFARIPSIIIDKNNNIIVMFDLRWGEGDKLGNDQSRISTGLAVSKDGGKTWTKKTILDVDDSKVNDENKRIMDSTMLYDYEKDEIYALHGVWHNGINQWNAFANENWENDSWEAVIDKSFDVGETWQRVYTFSKTQNKDVFDKYTFNGNKKIIGFLGGVGTGIKLDDKLIFPVQVTGHRSVNTSILYSDDGGKTFKFPDSENPFILNGSSEHMVFEFDNKLISVGRGVSDNVKRHSYYSDNLGKSWQVYEPLNLVLGPERNTPGAQSQGSTIKVILPSSNEAVLLTQPKSKEGGNYTRSHLTLYVSDGKNKENIKEVTEFYPFVGHKNGSGYQSLAYKDGVLLVAYEADGDIHIKNLTSFIPKIEKIIDEFKNRQP